MSATHHHRRPSASLLTAILSVVCVGLAVMATRATLRYRATEREFSVAEDQLVQTERGNERLAGQIERMRQPAWLALLARDRLNYQRPGETVVFVYKSEKPGTIPQSDAPWDERPHWRIWFDWLMGSE